MIDEAKHRYWKGNLVSCPRCNHRMSVEDYWSWNDTCPFCGRSIDMLKFRYTEVERDEQIFVGS